MSHIIMVVDNSPAIRKIMAFMLKQSGYQIVEAEDGLDALKKMEANPPRMVFADLNMPVMDGIELIRNMRADSRFSSVPVVMVTSESLASEKKEQAKAAGATAWVMKPFKKEQILSIIKKLLG